MTHAFISYVRENKEIVDSLASELRRLGIEVWLDREDIIAGKPWKYAIKRAIQEGAFFIACYSKELNTRSRTHMLEELRLAIEILRKTPIDQVWFIPVFLNQTKIPSLSISDHEYLEDIQAIPLYENWDEGVLKILKSMGLIDPDYRRISHLIDLIKDHPLERLYAIEQLESFGAEARLIVLAVPALIEALRDSNEDVRERAARALGAIGPSVPLASENGGSTILSLINALRDSDQEVRIASCYSLLAYGADAIKKAREKDQQSFDDTFEKMVVSGKFSIPEIAIEIIKKWPKEKIELLYARVGARYDLLPVFGKLALEDIMCKIENVRLDEKTFYIPTDSLCKIIGNDANSVLPRLINLAKGKINEWAAKPIDYGDGFQDYSEYDQRIKWYFKIITECIKDIAVAVDPVNSESILLWKPKITSVIDPVRDHGESLYFVENIDELEKIINRLYESAS